MSLKCPFYGTPNLLCVPISSVSPPSPELTTCHEGHQRSWWTWLLLLSSLEEGHCVGVMCSECEKWRPKSPSKMGGDMVTAETTYTQPSVASRQPFLKSEGLLSKSLSLAKSDTSQCPLKGTSHEVPWLQGPALLHFRPPPQSCPQ